MRAFQFWVLVVGSIVVSAFMLKQIALGRDLNQTQRSLIEDQQLADSAGEYEDAWQKLGERIYQASHQDPNHPDLAMVVILKDAGVEVRQKPPDAIAPGAAMPSPLSPTMPPSPSSVPKVPATP